MSRPLLADWRDRVIDVNGCLIWQGRIDPNGYARLGGKWAHRVIYEYELETIGPGMELDHTCQTPPCVNPEHLDQVTRAEHCRRTMDRLGKSERHLSAAYLRTLGMTYADIATALDYSGKGGAASAVQLAIGKGLIDATAVPRSDHLTDQDRRDIEALRSIGVPVREIAAWYGIHEAHASRLSRGLTSRGAA